VKTSVRGRTGRLLLISVPAAAVTLIVAAVLVEVWVRVTWDPFKGRPGFFVSDAARLEKLGANYDGWFAGVPVKTNGLGFRDTRDYGLEKGPRSFRILVLGDSVTFGHGSLFEHTYPFLLEQRLERWRPDLDWQVWNLGIPGYNSAQELAYLLDVGPRFRPDLVVVGFYENDILGNGAIHQPSWTEVTLSRFGNAVRTHWYSTEWYRRGFEQLRLMLFAPAAERRLLASAPRQEDLFAVPSQVASLPEQALTNPTPMSPDERAAGCPGPPMEVFSPKTYEQMPGFPDWLGVITHFGQMRRERGYRIVFFLNSAMRLCGTRDVFDTRPSKPLDDYLLGILSKDMPAVSSHDALAAFRPSQMPLAGGHSIGNSNAVKADVLFEFLRTRVLTALPDRIP